jgi:hypothetical protein
MRWVHQHDRARGRDELLFHHLARDPERGAPGALAGAALQAEKLAALDGELDVHGVFEVRLQRVAALVQARARGGEPAFCHRFDRSRGADAGDDVLALRVHQVLAVNLPFARRRVSRETHAGGAIGAGVPVHHRLHVHGRAPEVRHLVDAAVRHRALVVPGREHGFRGHVQLRRRVIRKRRAESVVHGFVLGDEFAQVGDVEVDVGLEVLAFLHAREPSLELGVRHAQHDVAEHVQQAAVGVQQEPLVGGVGGDGGAQDVVVQAQVQHGVHHPGHRRRRAAADAHEQRHGVLGLRAAGVAAE